jgi:Holliday junction resolvase RusA-like endonuclease
MIEPITVIIPGKPTPKGRPRFNSKTGGIYTPKKTQHYERTVGLLANNAMRGKEVFQGPVHLELRAHFQIPKSWPEELKVKALLGEISPRGADTDNIVKAVSDGLNKIVYRDDTQIVSIRATKVYAHQPFVVVTVSEVSRRVPDTFTEAAT